MIREEEFRISRRPYAVDLSSLRLADGHPVTVRVDIDAVWFRRRRGVLVAVIGTLWDFQGPPQPDGVHEALRRHDDGRYGGSWIARWDDNSYVSEHPQSPEATAGHLAVLRPMLANYPVVPDGYDGWWRFETSAERQAARSAS